MIVECASFILCDPGLRVCTDPSTNDNELNESVSGLGDWAESLQPAASQRTSEGLDPDLALRWSTHSVRHLSRWAAGAEHGVKVLDEDLCEDVDGSQSAE